MPTASEIAKFLNAALIGHDLSINRPCSWDNLADGCLTFCTKYSANFVQTASQKEGLFVIASQDCRDKIPATHVIVNDPRHDYARVASKFFEILPPRSIHKTAIIEVGAVLGKNISVGPYSLIGPHVVVGDDVEIRAHVSITGKVKVGDGTVIKSHAVIGEEGFGFATDPTGIPQRIPHFGGVQIGDKCLIGSHTTINRGTLDDTRIGNYVMLDDHVFIGHNAVLLDRVTVTGFANIGARNTLEEDSWIGPNSTLMNGNLKIGRAALVGIGSLILRSVPAGMVVQGSPARTLWPRKGYEHFIKD
jgi:UDP-3-O-[3-hydroxymyristoyl] glucosamine N-acyltransferase